MSWTGIPLVKNNDSRPVSRFFIIALVTIAALYLIVSNSSRHANSREMAYSEVLASIRAGKVTDIKIEGRSIEGLLSDETRFVSYMPQGAQFVDWVSEHAPQVRVSAAPEESSLGVFGFLIYWFPFFLIMGLWFLFMQNMQSGSNRALGFGRSRARMVNKAQEKVTFADVAGVDEAKHDLEEIVEFLKAPEKFQRLGGKIPRGVLLVGPPGTGKTLLARAVAGEADVPFLIISGSDFVEMFVGVGASRVRDMFEQAKKHAPCIVFIDEIDAVGRHRGAGLGGGNDEREQTLNQILVEMDGFGSHTSVILIAATNRPDVLDPALLRPGRFDRQVVVPVPDITGREKILKVHIEKVKPAPDVKAAVLARGTPGFSGADLANLVNEATLLAARRDKNMVTMAEFEDAKDKVMMGAERRSMAMSEKERKLTAYHEAGHAIVGLVVEGNDPLHKVTIIPRGRALGVTMNLPERDRYNISKKELLARIAMMFGGRVAEEIIFGKENVTSGASNDIMQATSAARSMVTEWGMSDKLGPLRYSEDEQEIFLGHSVTQRKNVSDATTKLIDEEVRTIIEESEKKARAVLTKHKKALHALSDALLERETLTGDEVALILRGKKLPPLKSDDDDDTTTITHSPLPTTAPAAMPSTARQSLR